MLPPQTFELTLEQQFALRRARGEVNDMPPEEMRETLLGAMRLLMIKDNAIRSLIGQKLLEGTGP